MPTPTYVDLNTVQVPVAGDPLTAAWLTTARDNLEALARPAGCKVRRTATQAIGDSSFTAVEFTASDLRDTDAFHDTSTNPSKIVIPAGLGGWYDLRATVTIASGSTGWTMILQYSVNGGSPVRLARIASSTAPTLTLSGADELALSAGDEVEIIVWQDSTASKDLTPASASLRLVAQT